MLYVVIDDKVWSRVLLQAGSPDAAEASAELYPVNGHIPVRSSVRVDGQAGMEYLICGVEGEALREHETWPVYACERASSLLRRGPARSRSWHSFPTKFLTRAETIPSPPFSSMPVAYLPGASRCWYQLYDHVVIPNSYHSSMLHTTAGISSKLSQGLCFLNAAACPHCSNRKESLRLEQFSHRADRKQQQPWPARELRG